MTYDSGHALELLRIATGSTSATFRDDQEEAIQQVVVRGGRLLVVQRTGWGKSLVYFIATKLLREAGSGPTLLISPLLALMRNQIAAAERMGVRAVTINSDNSDDWSAVEQRILGDDVDVVLISPERLANERFREEVLARISDRIALLVIDEAHCISDWGHDFRPHYRLIERILRGLPPRMRVLGTTATANERVIKDLETVLGPGLAISRGPLQRSSLALQTIRLPSQAARLAWLATYVPAMPGSGIIYTLTVRDANQVAEWLRTNKIEVEAYTGESGPRRAGLEQALLDNRVKALVATTALGMGFDKPDLGFVVHYQAPGSVVAYYQQVGRAGRALAGAYGILLSGNEELDITNWFIETAFPTRKEVKDVLDALENAPLGLTVPQLLSQVNASKGRVEKALLLLSLETPPPVVKDGSKWQLTAAAMSDQLWERASRLTDLRVGEQQQMQDYVNLKDGHMGFLSAALDGGKVEELPAPLPPLASDVDPGLVARAVEFLRRGHLVIKPREGWPPGGLRASKQRGTIRDDLRAEPGRALSTWGDAGWGGQVKKGKYVDRRFSDELVLAAAELFKSWDPRPAPTWVACIPSNRHPDLVPDFSRRLAARLGLRFVDAIEKVEDRPEQKLMANSSHQAQNVDGSIAIRSMELPADAVLLVDDVVDSRWTFTVAAALLRSHGSGPVFPMALALAGHVT